MLWSNAFKQDVTVAIANTLNTDLGAVAKIKFWDGAVPANTTDPDPGTRIASCGMSATPWATPPGATITANAISDDTSTVAGTVQSFRMYNSGGTVILQGTSGSLGTEDFVWDNSAFGAGDTAHILTFEIIVSVTP